MILMPPRELPVSGHALDRELDDRNAKLPRDDRVTGFVVRRALSFELGAQ